MMMMMMLMRKLGNLFPWQIVLIGKWLQRRLSALIYPWPKFHSRFWMASLDPCIQCAHLISSRERDSSPCRFDIHQHTLTLPPRIHIPAKPCLNALIIHPPPLSITISVHRQTQDTLSLSLSLTVLSSSLGELSALIMSLTPLRCQIHPLLFSPPACSYALTHIWSLTSGSQRISQNP